MLDVLSVGIFCIVLLLILIFIGVPLGISFILSGGISSFLILGIDGAVAILIKSAFTTIATPSWVAIPLFILLGSLAMHSGLASKAFKSANGFAAGLPGSIGIATTVGNAIFGAVSGSSIAAVTVFGKAALPEMRELNYDKSFAAGIIAASGTFASMIPPSTMFIIYAVFSNTSVAGLFFAGVIPGLLNALIFSIYIFIKAKKSKEIAKRTETQKQVSIKNRMKSLSIAWPILLIAIIILGGIYTGKFTPTEAAAVGSIAVLIIGLLVKNININRKNLADALSETASTTSMLFLINVGALFYAKVLTLSRIPQEATNLLTSLPVAPVVIVILICMLYFLLGMIMVPIGIYAMTLPVIIPILTQLGYDPIWFGVVSMLLMEIGAITPPVGLNVFALKGVADKDISISDIFKGVWPFVGLDIILLIILIAFPQISLWLPSLLLN